ncbi:heavy metal-associated isoprenylated plant protein 22-like [Impatiens glandulifera]|uniref:heavy metal-associated isoprenylated plant protein 22-like n=1 Tax=Impatiens glandulifera TaxID=253017 RepID=UPI001FB172F4|nr:heavy metal-associated isoprenylated plant protein 22-like [Impatiens glandulifera]
MGALDHISQWCSVSATTDSLVSHRKRKVMQTVEIKVKLDCDGCERRVKNAVTNMKGVKTVEVNRKQNRVTVSGYVEPNKVLKKVRSTGKKRAKFWPYVPYNVVSFPYVQQAYDRKAPNGFVKNIVHMHPGPSEPVEPFTTMFSDDNPNACTIM